MSEVTIIGLDIAKHVFQAHGVDASSHAILRKKITRSKLLPFFDVHPPCLIVLEACGGAHHWARELLKLGHEVRLIAPAYVKPFVKRQENDAADAEAICEAAQRPSMRFVPVKTEEQQAAAMVFRGRDLLVRQRTQISNALRGHMAEYGWIAPRAWPIWKSSGRCSPINRQCLKGCGLCAWSCSILWLWSTGRLLCSTRRSCGALRRMRSRAA